MRKWHWPWAMVLSLFALYLVVARLVPSAPPAVLLGAAVVVAARSWEVKGGLSAAGAAGLALAWGLWCMGGQRALTDTVTVSGYLLAWGATLMLAFSVGSLTHRTRELDRVNTDLRQAQGRLTALHIIATSLSTTLDVNRLMEIILEQLGKLWGYDFGAILLLDESGKELIISAARGYMVQPGERLPADAGVCGAVAQAGEPVLVADVTRDPRYIAGVRDARSELAVPLVWEGQILGVLNVESYTPDAYGEADLNLLTTVAEQAAASIGNARLHQRTRDLAITDPHTGLFNYRHFQDQVAAVLRDAQLTGASCSLIMMDLDHFKRCNDTYGHPTGDAILAQVAKVLKESCRSEDLLFRYGGEEFAIVLPGAPGEVSDRVAERVRERIASHPFITRSGRRLDFSVTASLGVASYPRDGLTQVDLLLAADKALYAAKSGGRNKVVSADAGAHADTA